MLWIEQKLKQPSDGHDLALGFLSVAAPWPQPPAYDLVMRPNAMARTAASMDHLTRPLKPLSRFDPLNWTIVGISRWISLDVGDAWEHNVYSLHCPSMVKWEHLTHNYMGCAYPAEVCRATVAHMLYSSSSACILSSWIIRSLCFTAQLSDHPCWRSSRLLAFTQSKVWSRTHLLSW